MTFVKDTSYREMPYSSEIPNGDYHYFLSFEKLIAKVSKHQQTVFQCRSIGVLHTIGHRLTLHDLENDSISIRVSLQYMKAVLPYTARPFTAQIFGFIHWRWGPGPVLYATIIKDILPPLALKLVRAMKWTVDNHGMLRVEIDVNRPQETTVTGANATSRTQEYQLREITPLRQNFHMEHDQIAQDGEAGPATDHRINIRRGPIGPVEASNQETHENIETCPRCERDRLQGMQTWPIDDGVGRLTGTNVMEIVCDGSDQAVPSSQTSDVDMRNDEMALVQNWSVDRMEAAHGWETVPVPRDHETYVSSYPILQYTPAPVTNYPREFYTERRSHDTFEGRGPPFTHLRCGPNEECLYTDYGSNSEHPDRGSQFLHYLDPVEQNYTFSEANHAFTNGAQGLMRYTDFNDHMHLNRQQPSTLNEAAHSTRYPYYNDIQEPFRNTHSHSYRRVSHTVVSDSEQPRDFGVFADRANGRSTHYLQHEPTYWTNDFTRIYTLVSDSDEPLNDDNDRTTAQSSVIEQMNTAVRYNAESVNRQSDVSEAYGRSDPRLGQSFDESLRIPWLRARQASTTNDEDNAAAVRSIKRRFNTLAAEQTSSDSDTSSREE